MGNARSGYNVRAELTISFIFDLGRTDELTRVHEFLSFARQRGVAISGNLDQLNDHKALAAAATPPKTNAKGQYVGSNYDRYRCPHCQQECTSRRGLTIHQRACQSKRAYRWIVHAPCRLGSAARAALARRC